jgi:flagellin-like hook-associated protein FlgL
MSIGITGIIGIPTTGVSDLSVRDQLVNELDSQQTAMDQLQTEISTGEQFQLPSQDPQAALQVMSIQSLLQRKTQAQTSISTIQSSLSQADSTLSSVANLLTSVQSAALSAVGSTANASQRQAVIEQIDSSVQQLVTLGNTQFDGQNLFGGTDTTTPPFSMNAAGNVVYSGNSTPTQSYVDVNQLFASSITGDQAFGATSQPIQGAALTPALSADTPLADLNGGQGVASGSIAISDGHSTSIVNLSGAQTLGDVAMMIERNPPAGRTVDVNVTPTGLTLQLEPDAAYPTGDNLSVQEVDGGATAGDLGILNPGGTGTSPLVGQPLTATVTPTTSLDDLFGTKAQANIHFGEPNSDIVLQANTPGSALNGVTVHFDNTAPAAGQESASYDAATSTLTVHISTSAASASRASQIVAAINAVPGLPFTASLDPANQNGGGQPPITTLPADTTTAGGSGTTLDTSGLQITSGGKTYTVSLSGDKTVQDLLNSINNSGAGLDAEINPAQTGINVSSRVSGADFSIGENGGTTATQLGLRTFTTTTQLSQLNEGAGVGVNTITPGGTDFTISDTINGTAIQANISIAANSTIGDVLSNIKTAIDSAAQAAGAIPAGTPSTFSAQLATTGNGIELTDTNPADGPIIVTADSQSTAAVDLGLVPEGQTSATSTATANGVTLTGSDTNPQQTDSVFNALLKLGTALQNNDSSAIQHAMTLLSNSMQNLGNARDVLGVQEQSLTTLNTQISNEQLNLQSAMSTDYDTDMASAISDYTSAQISYQATLETTASMLKMTLLNYL